MKKHTFGIASSALSGLLAAVLFACNTPVSTIQPNLADQNISVASKLDLKAHPYAFQGNVQFANKGFGVKATFEDLAAGAQVTLFLADGVTSAGNTVNTDANGNFTFVPSISFIPVTNQTYILEARKRTGEGSNILSLRTILRWDGSSYSSITHPGIFINTYTTALALMASKGDVTQNSTIGNILVSGGVSTTSTIGASSGHIGATDTQINDLAKLVTQAINFQVDPLVAVVKSGANYSLSSNILNPNSSIDTTAVGAQRDRLAIPSLNIVINGYNGFTGKVYDSLGMTKADRNNAKDLSNSQSPDDDITNYRAFWGVAINAVFPDTTDSNYANTIATALTPDVQTLDMSKPTSFGALNGNILNGRMLSDDVVDFELQTLSHYAPATDGVAFGSDGKTSTTTFPYLAAPW